MHSGIHDLLHAIAAAVLVGGGGYLVIRGLSMPRPANAPVTVADERAASLSIAFVIAAMSLGAGVIHLIAAPEHLEELGALGLGFVASGVFQIGWALLFLYRRSTALDRLGVVVNLAIVCAWAWSRTVGLPIDGVARPEPVGLADGVSVILELALVALVLSGAAIEDGIQRHRNAASGVVVGAVPVIGVILLGSLLAVGQLTGTDHDFGNGHGHGVSAGHVEEHSSR